jgi:hypothetical protein
MAKWNARAFVSATFDFEIEAETEGEVEARVKQYLKFVQGGKLEGRDVQVKTRGEDACTNIFLSVDEVEDIYEL